MLGIRQVCISDGHTAVASVMVPVAEQLSLYAEPTNCFSISRVIDKSVSRVGRKEALRTFGGGKDAPLFYYSSTRSMGNVKRQCHCTPPPPPPANPSLVLFCVARCQDRVVDLEKELSQVRSFYTKKLKEVERRAEAQMRALKRTGGRGTPSTAIAATIPSGSSKRDAAGGDAGGSLSPVSCRDTAATDAEEEEEEQRRGAERNRQRRQQQHGPRPPPEATAGSMVAAPRPTEGEGDASMETPSTFTGHGECFGGGDEGGRVSASSPAGAAAGVGDRIPNPTRKMPPTRETRGSRLRVQRGGRDGEDGRWGGRGRTENVGEGDESSFEGVLRAERLRHERELDGERDAAEARVSSLKLRLVQTAQVNNSSESTVRWGQVTRCVALLRHGMGV